MNLPLRIDWRRFWILISHLFKTMLFKRCYCWFLNPFLSLDFLQSLMLFALVEMLILLLGQLEVIFLEDKKNGLHSLWWLFFDRHTRIQSLNCWRVIKIQSRCHVLRCSISAKLTQILRWTSFLKPWLIGINTRIIARKLLGFVLMWFAALWLSYMLPGISSNLVPWYIDGTLTTVVINGGLNFFDDKFRN